MGIPSNDPGKSISSALQDKGYKAELQTGFRSSTVKFTDAIGGELGDAKCCSVAGKALGWLGKDTEYVPISIGRTTQYISKQDAENISNQIKTRDDATENLVKALKSPEEVEANKTALKAFYVAWGVSDNEELSQSLDEDLKELQGLDGTKTLKTKFDLEIGLNIDGSKKAEDPARIKGFNITSTKSAASEKRPGWGFYRALANIGNYFKSSPTPVSLKDAMVNEQAESKFMKAVNDAPLNPATLQGGLKELYESRGQSPAQAEEDWSQASVIIAGLTRDGAVATLPHSRLQIKLVSDDVDNNRKYEISIARDQSQSSRSDANITGKRGAESRSPLHSLPNSRTHSISGSSASETESDSDSEFSISEYKEEELDIASASEPLTYEKAQDMLKERSVIGKLESAKESFERASMGLEEAQASLVSSQRELEKAEKGLGSLSTELESKSDKLAKVNEELKGLLEDIRNNEVDTGKKGADVRENQRKQKRLKENIDALEKALVELGTIEEPVHKTSDIKKGTNEGVLELKSKLEERGSELVKLNEETQKLQLKLENLNEEKKEKESSVEKFSIEIASLEKGISELRSKKTGLEGKVSALESEIVEKQAALDSSKGSVSKAEKDLETAQVAAATIQRNFRVTEDRKKKPGFIKTAYQAVALNKKERLDKEIESLDALKVRLQLSQQARIELQGLEPSIKKLQSNLKEGEGRLELLNKELSALPKPEGKAAKALLPISKETKELRLQYIEGKKAEINEQTEQNEKTEEELKRLLEKRKELSKTHNLFSGLQKEVKTQQEIVDNAKTKYEKATKDSEEIDLDVKADEVRLRDERDGIKRRSTNSKTALWKSEDLNKKQQAMQVIIDTIPEVVKASTFTSSGRIEALQFVYEALMGAEKTEEARKKAEEIDTAISRLPMGEKLQLIDGLAVERTKEGLKVIQEQLPKDSSLVRLAEENLIDPIDASSIRRRSRSSSSANSDSDSSTTSSTISQSASSSDSEEGVSKPGSFLGSIFRRLRGAPQAKTPPVSPMPSSRGEVRVGGQTPLPPSRYNLFSLTGGLKKETEKKLADEFVAALNKKNDANKLISILRGLEDFIEPDEARLCPGNAQAKQYADLLIEESSRANNQRISFGNHYQLKINKETGIVTVVKKSDNNSLLIPDSDGEEESI